MDDNAIGQLIDQQKHSLVPFASAIRGRVASTSPDVSGEMNIINDFGKAIMTEAVPILPIAERSVVSALSATSATNSTAKGYKRNEWLKHISCGVEATLGNLLGRILAHPLLTGQATDTSTNSEDHLSELYTLQLSRHARATGATHGEIVHLVAAPIDDATKSSCSKKKRSASRRY